MLGEEGEEQQIPLCPHWTSHPSTCLDPAFHVCGETEVMRAPATCPRSRSTKNQCLTGDENPRCFCHSSSHHQVLCSHSHTTHLCVPVPPFAVRLGINRQTASLPEQSFWVFLPLHSAQAPEIKGIKARECGLLYLGADLHVRLRASFPQTAVKVAAKPSHAPHHRVPALRQRKS